MNYRHAYHAGNFADCMKHAVLLALLGAMRRKPAPFLLLDTHAGAGRYDVTTGPAEKTGEWRAGILPILQARPAALAEYAGLVDTLGLYPGSPAIVAAGLRAGDRLVACELHPQDAAMLKGQFVGRRQVAVHRRDGYAALKAFLPPAETRGLVLIDPPFEQANEYAVLAAQLAAAFERFRAGVYVAWYPIKHRAPVREFCEAAKLGGVRDVVTAEFWRRPPVDPARLNGCGLLVVNPPFDFDAIATPILQALVAVLGEPGAGYRVARVTDE